jgi:hypothetical protein
LVLLATQLQKILTIQMGAVRRLQPDLEGCTLDFVQMSGIGELPARSFNRIVPEKLRSPVHRFLANGPMAIRGARKIASVTIQNTIDIEWMVERQNE